MKFRDKKTAYGQPEVFASGELTNRFVIIAETMDEHCAMQSAIGNVAIAAMTSQAELDHEDARMALHYLANAERTGSRLYASIEDAACIARLMRQGGSSLLDDAKSVTAANIAEAIEQEVTARAFRIELNDLSPDDIE